MRTAMTALAATLTLIAATATLAGVSTGTDENDVILAGHDAVACFTESEPVLGSAEYTAEYDGAIYRFASAANRDAFRADPARYAPVYGGYCAYGMTFGKKFQVDGQAFQVVNDRLYVNKDLKVYQTWRKDIPGNIVKANAQWPKVKDIAPDKL